MELAVLLSVITLGALYFYFQPDLLNINNDSKNAVASEFPQLDATAINPVDNIEAIPSPLPTTDLDKALTDVFEMLEEVYSGAYGYYNALPSLVSKKGFLYNMETERFVGIDDLVSKGFVDSKYKGENILILSISPSSLKEYEETSFFEISAGLAVFAAYETKDGIAILSHGQKGVLYREHFNSLIEKYVFDHGEIRRPSASASEYASIITPIISYELLSEPVYARYVAADDKYAVVVLSTQSEPNKLCGYILENLESGYSVVYNNFETTSHFKQDINSRLPDLNLDLLPHYNIFYENDAINDSFPDLLNKLYAMQSDEALPYAGVDTNIIIPEYDKLIFSSGNDKYAYFVFESGTIILAAKEENWRFMRIKSWEEAETMLVQMEPENPPTYIILQE